MIRSISLQTRRSELTHADYVEHWRNVHGPLCHGLMYSRRYLQHHLLEVLPNPGGFAPLEIAVDGIAELWFDDADAMARYNTALENREVHADGVKIVGGLIGFFVTADTLWPARVTAAGPRCLALLQRSAGSSRDEFNRAWLAAPASAGALGHTRLRIISERPPMPQFPTTHVQIDGIAMAEFADHRALVHGLAELMQGGVGAARIYRVESLEFPSAWAAATPPPAD